MSITGEKPVQDMVMLGWTMQKQQVELRGFIKVFRIPSGVILDRIKAKFRDEESLLTISMPKSVKGISGDGIAEVKEEEANKERPKEITQIATTVDHQVPERSGQIIDRVLSKKETGANDQAPDEKGEEIKAPKVERMPEMTKTVDHEEFLEKEATLFPGKSEEENIEKKEEPNEVDDAGKLETIRNATDELSERDETPERKDIPEMKEQVQKQTSNDKVECETPQDSENQEAKKTFQADNDDHLPEQVGRITKEEVQLGVKETGIISEADQTQEAEKSEAKHEEGKEATETNDLSEEGKRKDEVSEGKTREQEEKKKPGGSRRFKLCAPCAIAGSALLASLLVIVIHWIRPRRR